MLHRRFIFYFNNKNKSTGTLEIQDKSKSCDSLAFHFMESANGSSAWFGSLAILIWILLCLFGNAKLQMGLGRRLKVFKKGSF